MGATGRTISAAAATLIGLAALPATAAPLTALTAHDIALYSSAFQAAERGDNAGADRAVAQVGDPCLVGKVKFVEITHDKQASYDELNRWMKSFADLPGASLVYELALRMRPAEAPLPTPTSTAATVSADFSLPPAKENHAAREAYFDGDLNGALGLARSSGDAWIAGLSAYRLGMYGDALISFERLAANPAEDDAIRAAGGFWAARAAAMAGEPDHVTPLLKIAAAAPDTFYGMIAKRKLELTDDPLGRMIDAVDHGAPAVTLGYAVKAPGENPLERLARIDPRAHRAVALAQLGRATDAGAEMRAGFADAQDDEARGQWMSLMFELNPNRSQSGETVLRSASAISTGRSYPTPPLQPAGGFTIDKSLVYAIAWQESRFNGSAVSRVGAAGLMQLMPTSAASVAADIADPTQPAQPIHLFDTGQNLQLGQAYVRWLENNCGHYDLLRTIAAYNGGPTTLARTENMLGPGADSLLVIESVPFFETRAYVKKVMAAYWSYRRQFGSPTRTLDAVASDLQRIDVRLDDQGAAQPLPSTPIQDTQASSPASQALEILLHRIG
ncbi:MAG TPA: lytic transglycosylase domain-containing protein [Caulobacteraceae bacterium]|nr:lytic transglycosylase domain-containing protein [Caulobacteraceae bacterium]